MVINEMPFTHPIQAISNWVFPFCKGAVGKILALTEWLYIARKKYLRYTFRMWNKQYSIVTFVSIYCLFLSEDDSRTSKANDDNDSVAAIPPQVEQT